MTRTDSGHGLGASLAAHPMLTIWSAGTAIVVVLLALFAFELRSEYTATLSNAERASQGFANVLAEHTARTFEAVDRTLRVAESVRSDFQAGRITQQAANQALRSLQKSSPALIAVGWTNAVGDVVAHSYDAEAVRANIADLPHFLAQRDGKSDGMFVAPLYRSKLSGRWISSASLRLNNADGSFAGVVTAPLDPSYFARTYRSVNHAPDDVVTVVSSDGSILFREPFSENIIGRSLKDTAFFSELLPKSPYGTFITKSPIDGRERIFAYRAVSGLPFIILVLQDRANVLTRWYEHIRIFGPMVTLLTLVVILGTAALSRRTAELTKKSALLEATLGNMHEGLIVVDQTDHIAICNRRALELLDLPESLMASRPLSQEVIDYQTQHGEFFDAMEEVRARLHPRVFEVKNVYERTRPNGTILEIRTVPFVDGGIIRTYKDITDWKKIEQELKDEEARYRRLADNSTDMIFQLDLNFVRQYVSPACHEILGYSPEELVGQNPVSIIHPEDADHVDRTYRAVVDGRARASVANRIRHRDGRWIWVEAELRLVRDAETRLPVGILGSLRDVSARKAIEAEAATARQQAEKAAEAQAQILATSVRLKDEFIGTVSHELRTPLTSITASLELLISMEDGLSAPTPKRLIEIAHSNAGRLTRLVNDILDIEKLEAGKVEFVLQHIALGPLLEDMIEELRPLAESHAVELHSEYPCVCVYAEPYRLAQVFTNLLSNAIKFSPPNSDVQVAVDEWNDGIRVTVRDHGPGIPENFKSRVFEKFAQADASNARQKGGSGLGLSIVKEIVERLGGNVGFADAPGGGTVFFVDLPRSESAVVVGPVVSVQKVETV